MLDAIVCWFINHDWQKPICGEQQILVYCDRCGQKCVINRVEIRPSLYQQGPSIGANQADVQLKIANALCERLSKLLDGVADALKGPPGELEMHGWSDLPELAAKILYERACRVSELETELVKIKAKCDELTSQLTSSEARRRYLENR
jgi:hypothetical protein